MVQRSANLYPAEPRIEWFMRHSTNVHTYNPSCTYQGTTVPAQFAPDASFVKLDSAGFQNYMIAHKTWRVECNAIDLAEHEKALIKRSLEHVKETVHFKRGQAWTKAPADSTVIAPASHPEIDAIYITRQSKTATAPSLSHKPHAGEARANKKKLKDERRKTKALLLQKRVEVEVAQRDARYAVVEEVVRIKTQSPLHAAELQAAQSAAKRSKAIVFGSTDLVANIVPEENWKVVTRKKGTYLAAASRLKESVDANGMKTVDTSVEPAASTSSIPKQAVRAPNTVVRPSTT